MAGKTAETLLGLLGTALNVAGPLIFGPGSESIPFGGPFTDIANRLKSDREKKDFLNLLGDHPEAQPLMQIGQHLQKSGGLPGILGLGNNTPQDSQNGTPLSSGANIVPGAMTGWESLSQKLQPNIPPTLDPKLAQMPKSEMSLGGVDPTPENILSYLTQKGVPKEQALGMLANIKGESNFNPSAVGDNGTSAGLFQHHADRLQNLQQFAGPGWQSDWKKQIDFALQEPDTQPYLQSKFSSPQEASAAFTKGFERPANADDQAQSRIQAFFGGSGQQGSATPTSSGSLQQVLGSSKGLDKSTSLIKAAVGSGMISPEEGMKFLIQGSMKPNADLDTISKVLGIQKTQGELANMQSPQEKRAESLAGAKELADYNANISDQKTNKKAEVKSKQNAEVVQDAQKNIKSNLEDLKDAFSKVPQGRASGGMAALKAKLTGEGPVASNLAGIQSTKTILAGEMAKAVFQRVSQVEFERFLDQVLPSTHVLGFASPGEINAKFGAIEKVIQNKINSVNQSNPDLADTSVGQPTPQGAATHKYNPQTGKVEPL